ANEVTSVRLVRGRLRLVHAEALSEETPEDLRVTILWRAAAALLPQVLGEARSKQIVFAIGHQRREEAREALRVELILGEHVAKGLSIEVPRGERAKEAVVPERMLGLEPPKLHKPSLRAYGRRRRS